MPQANIPYDTYKSLKTLTASGMPKKQAEAVVAEIGGIVDSNLATKQNIAEVKRDIAELKASMVKWGSAAWISIAALMVGLNS